MRCFSTCRGNCCMRGCTDTIRSGRYSSSIAFTIWELNTAAMDWLLMWTRRGCCTL